MSIETDFTASIEAIYEVIGEDATVWIDDIPKQIKIVKVLDYGADYEDYEAYRLIASEVQGIKPGDEIEIKDGRIDIGTRIATIKNTQISDDGLEVHIGI